MIVRNLKSVLSGHINRIIREYIDKDLPGVLKPLTDYLYVIVGMLMTVAVQVRGLIPLHDFGQKNKSSSIVCAVITPLCGIGVISLERAYSLIVGCCIGTTTTGLIAALANLGDGFAESMQVLSKGPHFSRKNIFLPIQTRDANFAEFQLSWGQIFPKLSLLSLP